MEKQKFLVKVVAIVLLLAMTLTLILPIFAQATAQDDLQNAQSELDRIDKELNSIKNEKIKQQEQKKQAQNQINLVRQQIAVLTTQINETNERLSQKQEELDRKKLDIYDTDELFKERLKGMYIEKSAGVAATVLAAESFSDFLTSTVYLQKSAQADTNLLKRLDEEKRAIEEDEAAIKLEIEALDEKKAAQNKKQEELASLLQLVNDKLDATAAKEESTKEQRDVAYQNLLDSRQKAEEEFLLNGGVGDYVGGDWRWPVPSSRRVSSYYGMRTLYGRPDNHTGVDISAGHGQAILASNSGVVTVASYASTGYGNRVMIDHGGNQKTLYAHCSSLAVTPGQYVTQGQVIAYIGSTGNSTGNHLHFEIRMNGQMVNPYPYIKDN